MTGGFVLQKLVYPPMAGIVGARFLEDSLRVQRATLVLLGDLEQLAQSQEAAGRVTLQDVLRAQIENLEDSRSALLAELKAALGLGPMDTDPPIPATFESSPDAESADALLETALAKNPGLRQMEADVRAAEAMLGLARKSGVPDFALGIEADVKASPVMLRPSAGMTLPIWRDKIAAEIARAQADKRAAEARLNAEQIAIAADLAAMLFLYRESRRDIELLAPVAVPTIVLLLLLARRFVRALPDQLQRGATWLLAVPGALILGWHCQAAVRLIAA